MPLRPAKMPAPQIIRMMPARQMAVSMPWIKRLISSGNSSKVSAASANYTRMLRTRTEISKMPIFDSKYGFDLVMGCS